MRIRMTEAAKEALAAKNVNVLRLVYDTENCCAVNGVPMLWSVDRPENDDEQVETNGPVVYLEKGKEVFFEENMVLDYKADTGCFQLKSDSQFYNPCMSLSDGRK